MKTNLRNFVEQNLYVAAWYSVINPNGRRINVEGMQNTSPVLRECWGYSGRSVDLTTVRVQCVCVCVCVCVYIELCRRSLWHLYVSPVPHILPRLNSAVIHAAFVTPRMVSARFAMGQAPACAATQTTAYWKLENMSWPGRHFMLRGPFAAGPRARRFCTGVLISP